MKYLIVLCLLTGCVTTEKVQRFIEKHPNIIEKQYVFNEVHDTTIVSNDTIIYEKISDTLYKWITEKHYIDRWKIKEILKPCRDSIKYIYVTKSVELYKDKYNKLQDINQKEMELTRFWRKGFFLLLFWVTFLVIIFLVIKSKL